MKTSTQLKIEKMRKGEKVPCNRCDNGMLSAVGNPATTNSFRCDSCGVTMNLTVKMENRP